MEGKGKNREKERDGRVEERKEKGHEKMERKENLRS